MKYYTIQDDVSVRDVHPDGIYDAFREESLAFGKALLKSSRKFNDLNCPCCGSEQVGGEFEKFEFKYLSCRKCHSLYVSPRPTQDMIKSYRHDSKASGLRQSARYLEALSDRLKLLCAQRVEKLDYQVSRFNLSKRVLDVRTRYVGFLQHLKARGFDVSTVDPLYQEQDTGIHSVDAFSGTNMDQYAVVSAFDVFEQAHDVDDLVRKLYERLEDGGVLVASMRSGSGFDIQTLWSEADVLPLEHLNLISVEGAQRLLESHGFKIVEMSTPGHLDVKMVDDFVKEHPKANVSRLIQYFMESRDVHAKERFQTFIQETLLSSHLSVVAQKGTAKTW